MSESIYRFIVENIGAGKIEKQAGIQLLSRLKQEEVKKIGDIAIIGMASRFPNASDTFEFWRDIRRNIDCIRGIPSSRRADLDHYLGLTGYPGTDYQYLESSYLQEIDEFDYHFFRLSPKEASLMDPSHRLFLQTAWHAIEDAGYGGRGIYGSRTGIFVGFYSNLRDMYHKIISETEPSALSISMTGNISAMMSGRIAYLLDLKGPALVVDTACSSSLVAVDLACQAIKNGSCEMAIAGGVKINTVSIDAENNRIGIESSDNRTRAFDDTSDGSATGEGVGAVLLKPLERALADGDFIYAVIKGSAVNQDGNSMSLTAPNPAAQTELLIKAWENAGIDPATISYIAAHGTGTNLGDPVEIKGISNAFRKYTDKKQFCAITSHKTQYGHLFEAAGICNLIQTVLALVHREIPPTAYFNKPNRKIKFEDSPVYVNTKTRKWLTEGGPRRCGVSAFGFSGTNCHVVLEEAPEIQAETAIPNMGPRVLVLSAKTETALQEIVSNYLKLIDNDSPPNLPVDSLVFTANTGRGHYSHRLAIIFDGLAGLREKLQKFRIHFTPSPEDNIYYAEHKIIAGNKDLKETGAVSEDELLELTETANQRIRDFRDHQTAVLEDICRFYIRGADIDWEGYYGKTKAKKIRLPLYPFARTRCWVDIPETKPDREAFAENDGYYSMVWQPRVLEPQVSIPEPDLFIVFKDSREIGSKLISGLRTMGKTVIEVEPGDETRKTGLSEFVIGDSEAGYEKFLAELKEAGFIQMIHLASITERTEVKTLEELENSQRRGVYSLFYLIKAVAKMGMERKAGLTIISEYMHEVTGTEPRINPENAPLFGLGKIISQEHPGLRCRAIDMDEQTQTSQLLAEINCNDQVYLAAYRNGQRYLQEFREIEIDQIPRKEITIRDTGIYLITGGAGAIGLEIAKYLAFQNNRVKLALLNRSPIPERPEWEAILAGTENQKLYRQLKTIREIEALGAEVILCRADVANLEEMSAVVNNLRLTYGQINGVIHGAGIPGSGFLMRKEEPVFSSVLSPKVQGTWILDALTKDQPLDFFIMFSSGFSLISQPGLGDYSAANSYLDSFAYYRNKRGARTQTINWVAWKEAGMAVNSGLINHFIFKAISAREAVAGFHECLNRELSQVLIGELNDSEPLVELVDQLPFQVSARIKVRVKRFQQQAGFKLRGKGAQPVGEVVLTGKTDQPFSVTEKKVAQIYSELLGFKEISIYDNFFELGGNSSLLARMLVRLNEEFPDQIKLSDLFSYTSVATLAQFIAAGDEAVAAAAPDQEIEEFKAMFSNIEKGNLSIEDALKELVPEE